jgi:hypothetical protein
VVIDDVIFNGRESVNALQVAADRDRLNPTVHGPCDQLSCPYLLFVADFDARSGDDSELRSYLAELWDVMELELRSVLRYCRGFAEVRNADGFASYLTRGQLETTMPFNDYWADGAPFLPKPPDPGSMPEPVPFPWISLAKVGATVAAAFLVFAGTAALFGAQTWRAAVVNGLFGLLAPGVAMLVLSGPLLDRIGVKLSIRQWIVLAVGIVLFAFLYLAFEASAAIDRTFQGLLGIANGLVAVAAAIGVLGLALVAAVVLARSTLVRRSTVPFPAAPDSDLPSVLKALYLQQRFQEFAIAEQGTSDAALHAAFGRFLAKHRPDDLGWPTQEAGVVRSTSPT